MLTTFTGNCGKWAREEGLGNGLATVGKKTFTGWKPRHIRLRGKLGKGVKVGSTLLIIGPIIRFMLPTMLMLT